MFRKPEKGVAYSYVLNNQVKALDCYEKALDANINPVNQKFEYRAIANIAVLLYNQKQYDEALKYYKKALVIQKGIKNMKVNPQLLLYMGNVYYDKNIRDTAKFYFEKSLSLAQKQGNTLIVVNALCSLSTFYIESGKYSKAKGYTEKSLFLSEKENYLLPKAVSLTNMTLIKLGLNETDSAELYGKKALSVAIQAKSMQFRRQAWDALYKIYAKEGKYKKAMLASRNYSVLNDSLLSDQSKQKVAREQMQYEDDKKEAILNVQNIATIQQQKTERNAAIGIVAILLIGGTLSFIFYKRKQDASQKQQEAEFNAKVADTELKALRAQMNPHFIFNSLNSINNYIKLHQHEQASEYLIKFSKIMRTILENSEHGSIPLSEDLKTLELYMQLEAKRLNNKLTYAIEVADNIEPENTLVPPMILQPFVENSIWHGIAKKEGTGHILINISCNGGMLHCVIDDDGIGLKKKGPSTDQGKQSMGMKITKSRIEIINKTKRSKGTVEMFNLADGVRVRLNLPLELSF